MLVYRRSAPQLLQNVIMSFGLTVVAIRLFLEFSPLQTVIVGNFHVAHMLYGGAALFAALLMVLIYQNSRVLNVASWLAGIGFGFFIDEIGKYVSLNNDYYYKLAAPLIYVSFLVTFSIFLFVKRKDEFTPQQRLLHSLFDLQILLEQKMKKSGFKSLKKQLMNVKSLKRETLYPQLAEKILDFIQDNQESFHLVSDRHKSFLSRFVKNRDNHDELYHLTKAVLIVLFAVRLLWVVPGVLLPVISLFPEGGWGELRPALIQTQLVSGNREFWPFITTITMEVLVILGLSLSLPLMLVGKARGIRLARNVLLFSIIFLGVFNLYFGQFSALISIILDSFLLTTVNYLRKLQYLLVQEKDKYA